VAIRELRVESNNIWIVAISFLFALVLSIVAMPQFIPVDMGYIRPEWVALVLFYWVIALPHRVGVLVAWVLGIALMAVAYIGASLYQRLRMFTVWQQSLIVFAAIGVYQLINFWIESIVGSADWSMWYLMPSIVSAFIWPWVFLVLRHLRRLFGVN
jgi:rod shape-determining protein MreD